MTGGSDAEEIRLELSERITAGQADEEGQHSAHEAPGET